MLLVMYFPPEIGSASHLFYEFARVLIERGHEVTVVTTFPRKYNLATKDAQLPSKYRRSFFVVTSSEINGPLLYKPSSFALISIFLL